MKSNKKIMIYGLMMTAIILAGSAIGYGVAVLNNIETDNPPTDGPGLGYSGNYTGNLSSLVAAMNNFSFNLYNQINTGDYENIFFSPYSIFVALAMTYEGARELTAEQMCEVLGIPQNNETILNEMKELYNLYNQNNEFSLSTANAIWVMQDYELLDDFVALIEDYYRGTSTEVDFSDNEEAAEIINTWVEEETNEKITDLVTPDDLRDAWLVLTNAIYFKGDWEIQFDPEDTQESDFVLQSGETIQVPMMSLVGTSDMFNYAETEDLQILELPYSGGELTMVIYLPKDNDIDSVEQLLNSENLLRWRESMVETSVDIYLPKFKLETEYKLKDPLIEMGMENPFSPIADFSGIDGMKGLFIDKVLHKAFIEVNEEGTEAAAATAVIMTKCQSIQPSRIVFNADHPFMFTIQHTETGNILFMGRMSNPLE
jgi:serpin B